MTDTMGGTEKYSAVKTKFFFFCTCLFLSTLAFPLAAATQLEMVIQLGHNEMVYSVRFSLDGRFCVSASKDKTVKLWSSSSGKLIRTFTGHTDAVLSAELSGDNRLLLSRSKDDSLKLWETISGTCLHTFTGKETTASCTGLLKNSKQIIFGGDDGVIRIWDVEKEEFMEPVTSGISTIRKLAISPDEHHALFCSKSLIAFFDVTTMETLKLINPYLDTNQSILEVSFSQDTKSIMVVTDRKCITIEADTGTVSEAVLASWGKSRFNSLCLSPDNSLVVTTTDTSIGLWSFTTGKMVDIAIPLFSNASNDVDPLIFSADISPDNKYIIYSGGIGGMTRAIEMKMLDSDFNLVYDFLTPAKEVNTAILLDKQYIAGGYQDGVIHMWDLYKANIHKTISGNNREIKALTATSNGDILFSGDLDRHIKKWDVTTGTLINQFSPFPSQINGMMLSPDEREVLVGGIGSIFIFEAGNLDPLLRFTDQSYAWNNSIEFLGKDRFVSAEDGNITIHDKKDAKSLTVLEAFPYTINSFAVSPDNLYIAIAGSEKTGTVCIQMWDLVNQKKMYDLYEHTDSVYCQVFSPDSRFLLSGGNDGRLILWDIGKGSKVKEYPRHNGKINTVSFAKDGRHVLSSSYDTSIRLTDVESGEYTACITAATSDEWLIYTSDGYWDSSPGGGTLLGMVSGLEFWNIDQFSIRTNRPDIILKRTGSKDKDIITHYYQQYKKRLKRTGLKENREWGDFHIPEAEIRSCKQENKYITLTAGLNDSLYNLKSYNIYNNDVPLFGAYGKELKGKSETITETIELSAGKNKIEISCMNIQGAESYRALTFAEYYTEIKGSLYFIGFGVSEYENKDLNLNYAARDVSDLAAVFGKMKGWFDNVYIKTFLNKEVTPDTIKRAKDFLKGSTVDDTFVLFISGHGIHDTDQYATYYYITHNTDIRNLPSTAADFDLLENMMQGIAPRKKLFLMDTCESGEIEAEAMQEYYALADKKGISARALIKSAKIKGKQRSYLYEKNRYIYNDLLRRSGAIVFSSCRGGEFSYESDLIQNGFFTEEIINALTGSAADKDSDGIVTTIELRNYVSTAVSGQSMGKQNPTVDRDNIYMKFGFPVK